jgi:hypothetical protein
MPNVTLSFIEPSFGPIHLFHGFRLPIITFSRVNSAEVEHKKTKKNAPVKWPLKPFLPARLTRKSKA